MKIDPELAKAARGDIPEKFVRVVGFVVRGDVAVVAQLTNEAPNYEIETVMCSRDEHGWAAESSGNYNATVLPTSETVSIVVWEEAPTWAVAARFRLRSTEHVVPIQNGIALATFDNIPRAVWPPDWPLLVAWIDECGVERPP